MKIFLLYLLLLAGCSTDCPSTMENWLKGDGKVKVLSTTTMIGDLVAEVGKNRIDHLTLISGDIDPHAYELVKGDDEKFQCTQVIFANGLGLEHGASLQKRLVVHPHTVFLGNEIQRNDPDLIIKKHNQVDPHIWMDMSVWLKAVDPIVEALSAIDPDFASEYQKNGQALKETLEKMDLKILSLLKSIPESKRYLVTSHDAFNYFTKRYLAEGDDWEKRCIAPEGLAPEGQLSLVDIQMVIEKILQYDIHTLFSESNVSKDSLKKIVSVCKEKGCTVKIAPEPLFADAMESYLPMMEYNAKVIVGALDGR